MVDCRSDYIFVIEDLLISWKKSNPFRNKDFEVTEEVLNDFRTTKTNYFPLKSFSIFGKTKSKWHAIPK